MEFTIKGRLIGLNEYTKANRTKSYLANKLKQEQEEIVILSARSCRLEKVRTYPIGLRIKWYEPNAKRDIDNITFAVKFILDGLVKSGYIENDSQRYVKSIEHIVDIDRELPRIEVEIKEIEEEKDFLVDYYETYIKGENEK